MGPRTWRDPTYDFCRAKAASRPSSPRRGATATARRRNEPWTDPGGGARRLCGPRVRSFHGDDREPGRRRHRDSLSALPHQGGSVWCGGRGGARASSSDRRGGARRGAPDEAAFEFVRRCIAVPCVWRATISAPPWPSQHGTGLTLLAPLLADIVERSKEAGTLRDDVEVTDIVVLLRAVRAIADLCDTAASTPSLRFLELNLDGLRPGHGVLAHSPLSVAQLAKLLDEPAGSQR